MKIEIWCALVLLLLVPTRQADTYQMFKSLFKYLNPLINNAKHDDILFYSPTNDTQVYCSVSALECFHWQLLNVSTLNKSLQNKLHKNLRKSFVKNSIKTCKQEQKENSQCRSCTSYPMVNSKEFLMNLKLLLQKTYSCSQW